MAANYGGSFNFRPRKYSPFVLGRSRSCALFSDSMPSGFARFRGYERLSQSMRLSDESPLSKIETRKKKSINARELIARVLFGKSAATAGEVSATEKPRKVKLKKKWKTSSWLPDPNRRWRVQGW
ncbi:hypothetical protein Nepgr_008153 [Nepenthes gracilis]|uniref:Uncharacterized protein n=1 Tax=Nepenthes gracilis TaxID=150966 RepID=A0AAD3XIZ6_NEPGR|nr:hypothetical protein Nepgr_008153 [Nepenthes gracilis]